MSPADRTAEIRLLSDADERLSLDSGAPELDRWLRDSALVAQTRDTARVYVITDGNGRVLAYSALVVATLSRGVLSRRAASGLPEHIPAVLLGKLAVSRSKQGEGLGARLLGHAARKALEVRTRAAARLLVADARDEPARDWYMSKGFVALRDSLTCYVRLKDLEAEASGSASA